MRIRARIWVSGLFCLLLVLGVSGQGDCPAIVETALERLAEVCEATGRNQACYGFDTVTVDMLSGDLPFTSIGDVIGLEDIAGIRTTPLDESSGTWGISLLRVQANLPDTLPGQNVTMLIFGDTEVENRSETVATVEVIPNESVNIREQPSTSAAVVGGAQRAIALTATGRLEDGTWVRVRLPDSGLSGWVSAQYLNSDAGFQNLTVVAADDAETRPMQAFLVRTGIGAAPCTEAPRSGLLVQTPEGVGEILLNVNGLEVELGSTAFVQARPGDSMEVSVLEGQAVLRTEDVVQIVPAGAWSKMPLNEDGTLAGSPRAPRPYKPEEMQGLPVGLFGVTVPPPLTEAELDAITGIAPQSGDWALLISGTDAVCSGGEVVPVVIETGTMQFTSDQLGGTLSETAPDLFSGELGGALTELRVISSTRFEGKIERDGVNCALLLLADTR